MVTECQEVNGFGGRHVAWRSKFPAREGREAVHRNSCENVSPTVPNPDSVSNQNTISLFHFFYL